MKTVRTNIVNNVVIKCRVPGQYSVNTLNASFEQVSAELKFGVNKRRLASKNCSYCKKEFYYGPVKTQEQSLSMQTIQHLLPKRRGGSNKAENLKYCCKACNETLNGLGDCPAILACMKELAKKFGYGSNQKSVERAAKRLAVWMFENKEKSKKELSNGR